jgi:hypothetical protein
MGLKVCQELNIGIKGAGIDLCKEKSMLRDTMKSMKGLATLRTSMPHFKKEIIERKRKYCY